MYPICVPSRNIGRTVRTAGNRAPSFRMRVTSSSNFPCSTAVFNRRGTSVGTFSGTWNAATLIFPITSSGAQPKRSAASAAYCVTVPCMSHVITEVSVVNSRFVMVVPLGTEPRCYKPKWFTCQPEHPRRVGEGEVLHDHHLDHA